jgi:Ca2+-transporting ATPase
MNKGLHLYHTLSINDSLEQLKSAKTGLSEEEAKSRYLKYGPNIIKGKEKISPFKIFLSQFSGLLVNLLFGAAVLSFLIHEPIDAIAILAILLLNGILGFIQEYKAEQALEALKKLETPHAKVTRDGADTIIDAQEVVPGDILILNEGDKIPADARIIEAFYFQCDESILTGESRPVNKVLDTLKKDLALPDRKNLVFSGTLVTKGKAIAVVYATGMETEIGKIAHLVSEAQETMTPLQVTLEKVGKYLGVACVVIAIPGLLLGLLKGREPVEMVMTAVSLAVSAIPEGLPVVVTIALALGTRKMVKKGVLIRKLPAVEALGSTDVICSDKTGTITINKMSVTDMVLPDFGHLKVEGDGVKAEFAASGDANYSLFSKPVKGAVSNQNLLDSKAFKYAVLTGIYCNDSDLQFGDPTERALLILGEQVGFSSETLKKNSERIDEVPFDSALKYMITLHELEGKKIAFLKGAPEQVLVACNSVEAKNKKISLTEELKKKLVEMNEELSSHALRVLAMAYKETDKGSFKKMNGYTFVGLVGMIDPPRQEVGDAVSICHSAGIRVLMITGDHPLTAQAIAKQVGIKFNKVITGIDIDKLGKGKLNELVEKESVFARVSPTHKLEILRALQQNKHLVAMTGDGVNDAPALKEANIGIAVGSGSDLAKEISDMVILDDNFATIAKAVSEGRGIFFNIKKFVKFLVAVNFDILVILTSILINIPLPFLPIHLLWLNLATDSLPALALSIDKYDPNLMKMKPYIPHKEIFHGLIGFSVIAGILAYFASMGSFLYDYMILGSPVELARTVAFSTTVLFEFFIVFSARSDKSAFSAGIFSNKYLLMAVGIGLAMQAFAVYFPYSKFIFETVPLDLSHFDRVLLFSSIGFVVIEEIRLVKYIRKHGLFSQYGLINRIRLAFVKST